MSFKSFLSKVFRSQDTDSRQEPIDWREKRRYNRVDLSSDDRMKMSLSPSPDNVPDDAVQVELVNLSLRGVRAFLPKGGETKSFSPGQILYGTIHMKEFPVLLRVEIVRVIEGVEIGARLNPPFPTELEKLDRFLEPRCLGLSVREIDPSALQKEDDRVFRWFHGVNDTSLFSWSDAENKNVVHLQLVFLENVVEWKESVGTKTGKVRSGVEGSEQRYGWVKSDLIELDATLNPKILEQAKVVVQHMRIDSAVKDLFLEKI